MDIPMLTVQEPVKPKAREYLKFERKFTTEGINPLDTVLWITKNAVIKGSDGKERFRQDNVEVPASWEDNTISIVVEKYFRVVNGVKEHSAKQMFIRVASWITHNGIDQGLFSSVQNSRIFYEELLYLLAHGMYAFNSPVWFNAGAINNPQCSACMPYEMVVNTTQGLIQIGEIVERFKIKPDNELYTWDRNGQPSKIIAAVCNGKRFVMEYELEDGSFLRMTSDHIVFTMDASGKITEKQIGDMDYENDSLILSRQILVPTTGQTFSGFFEITPDMAWVSGVMVGDGFSGHSASSTSDTWELKVNDKISLSRIQKLMDFHGIPWAVTEFHWGFSIRGYGSAGRVFWDRLELWNKTGNKEVPTWVFTSRMELIGAFLQGLFDADGTVIQQKNNRVLVQLANTSAQVIYETQALLKSFGIFSSIRPYQDDREDSHRKLIFYLTINDVQSAELFGLRVGFTHENKSVEFSARCPNLEAAYRKSTLRIVGKRKLGPQLVYDIQTECGSFWADSILVHNCFINSVEDTMESILDLQRTEVTLFRGGSGAGSNLSNLRSSWETLSRGGYASGPVSFMKGYDSWAGVTKSGGTTRRAAKLSCLNMDHPDILEQKNGLPGFITCKSDAELQAHALYSTGKYSAEFNVAGNVYDRTLFQNANHSVRVTDEFMQAVIDDKTWSTKLKNGETHRHYSAKKLFEAVAEAAWVCGDPGIQFDTATNGMHTCPGNGRINASNPCVSGDTLISTPNGDFKISDLTAWNITAKLSGNHNPFVIINDNGCRGTAVNIWKTGIKPVFLLTTRLGHKLKLTEDHLVFTYNRGDVPAQELTKDDILKTTKNKEWGRGHLGEFSQDSLEKFEYVGVEDVYDITETTSSHFIANGIVVHNCSEYLFLDDTACNLASLNLMKFLDTAGNFEINKFKHAVDIAITAKEIIVDASSYPTEQIAKNSHKYRTLGLGFTNLGALLTFWGLPYDSEEGRKVAGAVTSLMGGEAYFQSAKLAEILGPFSAFKDNDNMMLKVIRHHHDAALALRDVSTSIDSKYEALFVEAEQVWVDAYNAGDSVGFRNAQTTVIAPTGCISPDSLVLTSDGLVPIDCLGDINGNQWQDTPHRHIIQEDDTLITQSTKFYINGHSPVLAITTEDGYNLVATPNHQIRILSESGEYIWRRMDMLQSGDQLAIRVGGHEDLLSSKPYVNLVSVIPSKHLNSNKIVLPDILDESLAELLGMYMANGYMKGTDGLRIVINSIDTDLIDYIDKLCKKLFSISTTLEQRDGCVSLGVGSNCLESWFFANQWAKSKGNYGEGAASSFIPLQVLQSRSSVLSAFLRGYFEMDGTVGQFAVEVCTVSEILAKQLHVCLTALGVLSSISSAMPTKDCYGYRRKYRIKLKNKVFAYVFQKKIGFLSNRKNALLNGYAELAPEIVRGVGFECGSILKRMYDRSAGMPNDVRQDILVRMRQGSASHHWFMVKSLEYPHLLKDEEGIHKNIFYSKITYIEQKESNTYDISVPHRNSYIANGIVSHNTISFLMGCDTTGIEPMLGVVTYKKAIGEGFLVLPNNTIKPALKRLGYSDTVVERILQHIVTNQNIHTAPDFDKKHGPIFAEALGEWALKPEAHVDMMAAVQPFISGGISKTVNMPNKATKEDIAEIYLRAWRSRLKCVAVYRDGCKMSQPISTKADEKKESPLLWGARKKLSKTRAGKTHSFRVSDAEGYLTANVYPDGTLGEIFVRMSKQGSFVGGIIDSFAINFSMALQSGTPLDSLVDKFKGTRFEPSGFTGDDRIPIATSILDYIVRWLELEFLKSDEKKTVPSEGLREFASKVVTPPTSLLAVSPSTKLISVVDLSGNPCRSCGGLTKRTGSCYTCMSCGDTTGCG